MRKGDIDIFILFLTTYRLHVDYLRHGLRTLTYLVFFGGFFWEKKEKDKKKPKSVSRRPGHGYSFTSDNSPGRILPYQTWFVFIYRRKTLKASKEGIHNSCLSNSTKAQILKSLRRQGRPFQSLSLVIQSRLYTRNIPSGRWTTEVLRLLAVYPQYLKSYSISIHCYLLLSILYLPISPLFNLGAYTQSSWVRSPILRQRYVAPIQ